MLQPMLHEDFYCSGRYSNRDVGVVTAFVCSHSHSPGIKWDASGQVGCFISGEVFIEACNPDLKNDTAFALATLYEREGLAAFEKLNGWFSGVLVDARQHQAILFNDRYGLNRVYIHKSGGHLYFASEAKSLLAINPALRELDPRSLGEWFSCGCPLGNRTLFRGIELLPPGSAWILCSDGSFKKEAYFKPVTWAAQAALSPDEFSKQLHQIFPRVLSRYTDGSRPMAMSLTGGLDGRMIMAWARPEHGKLPCYTFNGTYRDCADVRIARKIATLCGQSHQTISVGEDFLAQFPRLAEQTVRITDGAMDVTGAAELYVNRLARRIAPVRLTGNYGSEILRRHVAFRPRALTSEIFSADFSSQLSDAAQSYAEETGGDQLSFIAFKQVPWHHYARLAVEQSQITLRSPYLDNELVALAFRAPGALAASLEPSLRLIAAGNPALGHIPTDRGVTYPDDRITSRAQRSMKDFLAKAEYAYDYGMPDWLARVDKCLGVLRLEKLFLGHQKFCHFRSWYRGPLAEYVREVLLDSRSRGRSYLNGAAIESLVEGHIRGTRNCTIEIHKLLSVELLYRSLLERS